MPLTNSATGETAPIMPDLISVPEAAQRLGLHSDTLYRLCRTGTFPPAVAIGLTRAERMNSQAGVVDGQAESAAGPQRRVRASDRTPAANWSRAGRACA